MDKIAPRQFLGKNPIPNGQRTHNLGITRFGPRDGDVPVTGTGTTGKG
jgi:hypothetical protein